MRTNGNDMKNMIEHDRTERSRGEQKDVHRWEHQWPPGRFKL